MYEKDEYRYGDEEYISTALILCAGFGKRMREMVDTTPKPLLEISKDVTLLDTIVANLVYVGVRNIIITTHYQADKIRLYVEQNYFNIYQQCSFIISEEQDGILDTGGGIFNVTKHLGDEYILSVNCDVVWDEKISLTLLKLQHLFFDKIGMYFYMVFGKVNEPKICNFTRFTISRDNSVLLSDVGESYYLGIQIINVCFFNKICKSYNQNAFPLSNVYLDYIDENGKINNTVGFFHEKDACVFHVGTLEELEDVRSNKWLR